MVIDISSLWYPKEKPTQFSTPDFNPVWIWQAEYEDSIPMQSVLWIPERYGETEQYWCRISDKKTTEYTKHTENKTNFLNDFWDFPK